MDMDTFAARASACFRRSVARLLSARARLQGKAFVCDALAGNSELNICINSDLTVSCSCRDFDGSGRIGDLNRGRLEDAFFGPTAIVFRAQLAAGHLPTPSCVRCCDLRSVPRAEARRRLAAIELPKFIMVENTSACNLKCASCPRASIQRLRTRRSMSLDDVEKVALALRRLHIRQVAYLNLGEPFLSKRLGEELRIIRRHNPAVRIHTSTNGVLLATDKQRDAALLFDHIQFSLDGIDQKTAARYQRGTDFDAVYRNMKDLVAYRDARGLTRPRIVWKYLLFRWNERRRCLLAAVNMARDAGVDEIWFERTVSPFYGLPWRSYLGCNQDLGTDNGFARCVTVRDPGNANTGHEEEQPEPVLVTSN